MQFRDGGGRNDHGRKQTGNRRAEKRDVEATKGRQNEKERMEAGRQKQKTPKSWMTRTAERNTLQENRKAALRTNNCKRVTQEEDRRREKKVHSNRCVAKEKRKQ